MLPQTYPEPDFSGGAETVGGQMHGDKECLASVA